jgi:hypothetical protein
VTVRAWQSLEADGSWKENTDRSFPMVDVRCSPPQGDDNQSTLQVQCAILFGTKVDDDKSHAFIAAMYEAGQGMCDNLFSQFRSGTYDGDEIKFFLDKVDEALESESVDFKFGGFTFGEGLSPSDDSGVNMIGITLIVHYGRSDF